MLQVLQWLYLLQQWVCMLLQDVHKALCLQSRTRRRCTQAQVDDLVQAAGTMQGLLMGSELTNEG